MSIYKGTNIIPNLEGSVTRGYLAVRWEGSSNTSATPGSSNSIYELYLFYDGWCELRIGNWTNDNGVKGVYSSGGVGFSFANISSGYSYVFPLVGDSDVTPKENYVYENGKFVYKSNASDRYPISGAGPTASASWPPSGWTSLINASADDASVSLQPATASIRAIGSGSRVMWAFDGFLYPNSMYVGSNGYITFGSSSTAYSSLSTTNPAINKIMIDAADRSYQQVGWKVGSK